jgi:hypothetical protein
MTPFDSKATLRITLRGSFLMSDTYFHDLVAERNTYVAIWSRHPASASGI